MNINETFALSQLVKVHTKAEIIKRIYLYGTLTTLQI